MELQDDRFVEPPRARRIRLNHRALMHAYRSIGRWWLCIWPEDVEGCWMRARKSRDHLCRSSNRYHRCKRLDDLRAEAALKEQLGELLDDIGPE
jgi:hypothetical protein